MYFMTMLLSDRHAPKRQVRRWPRGCRPPQGQVGKAIQENSPYSVISQDSGYGYDRAVAAFSRREVSDAFEEYQKRTAGRFAE